MNALKLVSVIAFGVAIAFGVLMQGTNSADAEENWWPAKVQIYNPSCTDGDPACWAVALAAGLKDAENYRGKNIAVVVCGRNIALDAFRAVLDQGA